MTFLAADHCLRCGATEKLTRDHVIPRAKGGATLGPTNLQTLCDGCNVWKGSRRVLDYRNLPARQPTARGRTLRDQDAYVAGRALWFAFLAEQRKPVVVYVSEAPE